jgi:hypothetical protein
MQPGKVVIEVGDQWVPVPIASGEC